MLNCRNFFDQLNAHHINFFCGVPDSLLRHFCAYVDNHTLPRQHVIAANEGNAIALAAGYYLSTGRIALAYMQNSGLGNCVNPLVSLMDQKICRIPVLLMIGWRGVPGRHDEPQHLRQGIITPALLKLMGIPYTVLPDKMSRAKRALDKACDFMKKKEIPYAFIVEKETFAPAEPMCKGDKHYTMSREQAIRSVAEQLGPHDVVVATTGKISRELYEYRKEFTLNYNQDFLVVGSMGHASQIALGIALQKPRRQIFCFDGDGSVLMHMGGMAIIGVLKPENFKHIIFNNGAHDSVGGQPTVGFHADFLTVAKGCGYRVVFRAENHKELKNKISTLIKVKGPAVLEIRVTKGARQNLGRPTLTPIENRRQFMQFLK